MPASTRTAVVRALQRLRRENGYSNMVLDGLLSRGEIPPQDQAFASRLFYGVLERQMTLDYVLGSCSSQPLRPLPSCRSGHPAGRELSAPVHGQDSPVRGRQ